MSETFVKTHLGDKGQPDTWAAADLSPTLRQESQVSGQSVTVLVLTFAKSSFGSYRESEIATALTTAHDSYTENLALISSTEDSPVRMSRSPGSGEGLEVESEASSGGSSIACCDSCGHDGRSLRMSPDFYPAMEGEISPSSSPDWQSWGSMRRGRYWTRNGSDSRSGASVCSLSAVLEDEAPSKYWLSARAAKGILRRSEERGKSLPEPLREALLALAETEGSS